MGSPIPSNYLTFNYLVPKAVLKPRIDAKVQVLEAKVVARKLRIIQIRKDHEIDDLTLIELLKQARSAQNQSNYTVKSTGVRSDVGNNMGNLDQTRTINAGVVSNILTEQDAIEDEETAASRLRRVSRNIEYAVDPCTISYGEIAFLDM